MIKIGTFKIQGSFKITGRGLVAFGQIIEGKVKIGSHFTLNIKNKSVAVQVTGVEMMDNISTQESWVGLLFHYSDQQQGKEFDQIKLTEQVVEIFQ
jgi:translation elongation factor EF-Tu-like GTPase